MKLKKTIAVAALALAPFSVKVAMAGPYTDDLSKCLVASTTTEDRTSLVRWLFLSASSHPALASLASASKPQVDAANRMTAELFMRLLTNSCAASAKNALRYEGQLAFQQGFQVLGQVAGQELFASKEVAANMSGLAKYIDGEKLKAKLSD